LDQKHNGETLEAMKLDDRPYYDGFLVAMDALADGRSPVADSVASVASVGSYRRFMAGAAGLIRELRADKYENDDLKERLERLEGPASEQCPAGVGFTVHIDEARAVEILESADCCLQDSSTGGGDLGFLLTLIKETYPKLWASYDGSALMKYYP